MVPGEKLVENVKSGHAGSTRYKKPDGSSATCRDPSGPIPRTCGSGYFLTCFFSHLVVTLLGRSIGEPMARLMISWLSIPMALETENSTV